MNMIAIIFLLFLSNSLFTFGQGQNDTCECGDEDSIVLQNLQDTKELRFPLTDGQNYPNNCDCSWRIGSGYHVNVVFNFFETQEGHDFVEVYDLAYAEDSKPEERCSGTSCSSLTSKGPGLRIRFTSDATVTMRGFRATVVSVEGESWLQWFHIAIILFGVILVLSVVFGICIMYRRRQAWISYVKQRRRANPPNRSRVVPPRPAARVGRAQSLQSHHRSNAVYTLPSVTVTSGLEMVEQNPSPPPAYYSAVEAALRRPRGASLNSTSSLKFNALPTIIENQEMKYGSY